MAIVRSEPVSHARGLRGRPARQPQAAPPHLAASGAWVGELRSRMSGGVVTSGQSDYDARRALFDVRFDFHPQAIALCASEDDIRSCLALARDNGVAFRIRGGGHSFAGFSGCDGLVIDVSFLDRIAIDQAARRMTVGGGCQQSKVMQVLAAAGLHVPTGEWETVCIGGYMQGGGFGSTSRTYGMNSDNVVAVRVMLADGRVIRADADVNHDLWWAVRGGTGNNFGVLLEITYQLYPMPQITSGEVAFSLALDKREQGIAALMAYQAGFMVGGAPDAVNCSALIAQTDDATAESPWLVIQAFQIGSAEELNQSLQPLLALPGATVDFDPERLLAEGPMPPFSRTSRLIGRTITAREWRDLLALLDTSPNRQTQLFLKAHGGAINAYKRESSAFIHRNAHCNMFLDSFWPTPGDREPAEAFRGRWRAHVEPLGNGHIYQNFPELDAPDYTGNYWGDAYPALAAVKAKYDPGQAFDFPQAVKPGDAGGVRWPPLVVQSLLAPILAEPLPTMV